MHLLMVGYTGGPPHNHSRYVMEEEGLKILKDIYEGECRSHEGAQTITQKTLRE